MLPKCSATFPVAAAVPIPASGIGQQRARRARRGRYLADKQYYENFSEGSLFPAAAENKLSNLVQIAVAEPTVAFW